MKADIIYTIVGDFRIPLLVLDEPSDAEIGIWGCQRKEYLYKHKQGFYATMLFQGTLTQYLIDINRDAIDMIDDFIKRTAVLENVTESLKYKNQSEWIRKMDSIRSRAEEYVRHNLINR